MHIQISLLSSWWRSVLQYHFYLSQYPISAIWKQPKSVEWQKNFIFGSLNHSKNAFLQCLNDPSCTGNSAGCYKTLSAITICIIKSIQETKLQILAKILLFGTLDHSKMHFCDFWMIQHVPYCSQIVNTILQYHNMQYQVDPRDQTPDIGQNPPFWHFGSFKNAFLWLLNDPACPKM